MQTFAIFPYQSLGIFFFNRQFSSIKHVERGSEVQIFAIKLDFRSAKIHFGFFYQK